MLCDPWSDAIVATVRRVSEGAATNGNPPRVELEVHEVLRGDAKLDRKRAVFAPFPHDVDTGTIITNPRYKAWAQIKMTAPQVGSKWILCGGLDEVGGVWYARATGIFEFSPERRLWAIKIIEETEAKRRAEVERREAEVKAQAEVRARWLL